MTESIVPVTGSVISDPDAQAAIWFLGALSQVRVSGAQTGGACEPLSVWPTADSASAMSESASVRSPRFTASRARYPSA